MLEDFLESRVKIAEIGSQGALEWLCGKRAGGSTKQQIVGQILLAGEGCSMERGDANGIGGVNRRAGIQEQAGHVRISGLCGDVQGGPPFLK